MAVLLIESSSLGNMYDIMGLVHMGHRKKHVSVTQAKCIRKPANTWGYLRYFEANVTDFFSFP